MVKIICGMIGSGKTTYALNNKKRDDILLDWDLLVDALKTDNPVWIKEVQDLLLKFFSQKGFDVWYITTKLGSNELELLEQIKDVEYIWINTDKNQCIENIRTRNRNDEAKHIEQLRRSNERIYNDYYTSKIKYKIVNVFDNNERW
ncbi:MAG: hypothetical protein IJV31_10545 [Clostridia bacterium]|nr:hypothetical protein [Clostridia bacterium]